jgi:hypothetical protein
MLQFLLMLRLIEDHSNNLLSKPEFGMGYQIVEATLLSGEKQVCVVYNAELLVAFKELEEIKKFASYDLLLKESLDESKDISLEVINRPQFLKSAFSNTSPNPAQLLIEYTRDGEEFKRFSAYTDDKRITPGRGLRAGTYATTVNNTNVVPSGLSAVARYALPNPWPAIYVFTITPPKDTEIQCGTVQPAFRQSGGGVEIFFKDAIPGNIVSGPDIIPER